MNKKLGKKIKKYWKEKLKGKQYTALIISL